MTNKCCGTCFSKKRIGKWHYKCTESKSSPNTENRFEKNDFTGLLEDLKDKQLGCTCIYWTGKEQVQFS